MTSNSLATMPQPESIDATRASYDAIAEDTPQAFLLARKPV